MELVRLFERGSHVENLYREDTQVAINRFVNPPSSQSYEAFCYKSTAGIDHSIRM
jgi:hypothetical protein